LIVAVSIARVWLHIGFKLALPDDRPVPSIDELRRPALMVPLLGGIVLCLASVAGAAAVPAELAGEGAAPAAVVAGVSAQRLQRLDAYLADATSAQGYLGAVSLVQGDGQVVHQRAFGHQDLERSRTMRGDSLFRIYSMTKTVTTVAVMLLVEEGVLALDDPLERHLPAFADMQVLVGGSADEPRLVPVERSITLRHLLTHTAGFANGGAGSGMATQLLERAQPGESADLREFAARVARVPLAEHPGTRFRYDGTQFQLLSRVVEVASGQSFDAFLQQRIFTPLGMVDTGFEVPQAQRHRVVDMTRMGKGGQLVLDQGPSALDPGAALNPYLSGAGGLYSTAPDFMRLCVMLLDQGRYPGGQLLGRKTVEAMFSNQLGQLPKPVTEFSDAEGFGLGGSVLLDPALKGRLGSVGQYGWSGAASTYFSIDPHERLVSILLLQHLPNDEANDLPRISTRYYNLVYQALVD